MIRLYKSKHRVITLRLTGKLALAKAVKFRSGWAFHKWGKDWMLIYMIGRHDIRLEHTRY